MFNLFKDKELEREFTKFYYTKRLLRFKVLVIALLIIWHLYIIYDLFFEEYPTRGLYVANLVLRVGPIVFQLALVVCLFLPYFHDKFFFMDFMFSAIGLLHTCAVALKSTFGADRNNYASGVYLTVVVSQTLGYRVYLQPLILVITLPVYITSFLLLEPDITLVIWCANIILCFSISLVLSLTIENIVRNLFVRMKVFRATVKKIEEENNIQNSILYNVLPPYFVEKVREDMSQRVLQHHKELIAVLTDFVGFTEFSSRTDAKKLIETLNVVYTVFDKLCNKMRLEKIKTIGDAYLAVDYNHMGEETCIQFGLRLLKMLPEVNRRCNSDLKLRIGMAKGDGFLVVLGQDYLSFDLLGPVVNTSKKMETTCTTNHLQIDESMVTDDVSGSFKLTFQPNNRGYIVIRKKSARMKPPIVSRVPTKGRLQHLIVQETTLRSSSLRKGSSAGGGDTVSIRSNAYTNTLSKVIELDDDDEGEDIQVNSEDVMSRVELEKIDGSFQINYFLQLFKRKQGGENKIITKEMSKTPTQRGFFRLVHICTSITLTVLLCGIVWLGTLTDDDSTSMFLESRFFVVYVMLGITICSFIVACLAIVFAKSPMVQFISSLLNGSVLSNLFLFALLLLPRGFIEKFNPFGASLMFLGFIQFSYMNQWYWIRAGVAFISFTTFVILMIVFIDFYFFGVVLSVGSFVYFGFTYFFISCITLLSVQFSQRALLKWQVVLQTSTSTKSLIKSFLPEFIVNSLIVEKRVNAFRDMPNCSVLFVQINNFQLNEHMTSEQTVGLVNILNDMFIEYDSLCLSFDCLKIKSINNVYLVCAVDLSEGDDGKKCKETIGRLAIEIKKTEFPKNESSSSDNSDVIAYPVELSSSCGIAFGKVVGGIERVVKNEFSLSRKMHPNHNTIQNWNGRRFPIPGSGGYQSEGYWRDRNFFPRGIAKGSQ